MSLKVKLYSVTGETNHGKGALRKGTFFEVMPSEPEKRG